MTELYLKQISCWPTSGRHIMAQFDENTVVVYQAFNAAIGGFAAEHGYFGGDFSFNRMSWIKTNFLWMMYRSGWGTKPGQEVVLAIWLKRKAFEKILAAAVPSQYVPKLYSSKDEWQQAVKRSQVRLQWDPDYDPCQMKVERRAIQLGLQGRFLSHYARDWIVDIQNISEFVHQQYPNRLVRNRSHLLTPVESVYRVSEPNLSKNLGLT
ncbi:MAG: DUF4291 domain-containing protein [Spirulinaceae cyanobacterium]